MFLDQRLVDAAIELLDRRWPGTDGAVAAALRLDDGLVVTSVGLDNLNAAATLCAETGVLCQAYTLNRRVTASVCVARDAGRISVLAPCGICQERLALWGPGVQIAVADHGAARGWSARTLGELYPHYWGVRFAEESSWRNWEERR